MANPISLIERNSSCCWSLHNLKSGKSNDEDLFIRAGENDEDGVKSVWLAVGAHRGWEAVELTTDQARALIMILAKGIQLVEGTTSEEETANWP
jgi:hypothetical protein